MNVAIVDYGMGNLHSVLKSVQTAGQFDAANIHIQLTNDAEKIRQADKVIFPGQGAIPDCMAALHSSGLGQALEEALTQKPFLGICVGAQLLFEHSEEGHMACLGWFEGQVRQFDANLQTAQGGRLKVPHMGWNRVHQTQPHPLFSRIDQDEWFYFVHSYYFAPENQAIVLANSDYGHEFACIVGQDNVFATQFHVEKSYQAGLQLLANFLRWDGTV
ncbi:imidazole glycerol phosphate synthase subunit HisH [Neisseriaceae bacterium ESL0693]|nr:imidazole glycerol phosphate synthase subunit HisH [Neisseriaceae bacterium ESL0693]